MKRDQDLNNPLSDFLGKYIGDWCEPIIEAMPQLDKDLIFNLMDNWWHEQIFIEKYVHDPFLIYGHVAQQDDYIQEIRTIINKHVKTKGKSVKADK
jgi:hypothetical protein